MIEKTFTFFEEGSSDTESKECLNGSAKELVLEVTGSGFNLEVLGAAQDEYYPLFAVNLKTVDIVENITEEGNYILSAEGMRKIKITNSGSTGVTVYGKLVR